MNGSHATRHRDKLITKDYCLLLTANFLLYFGFYMLLPVMPFYLTERFAVGSAQVGLILACYTVAALTIRPFSGYLLDTFARKPLYLISYIVFTAVFAGYMAAGLLSLFVLCRIVHGLSFGAVSVAGNTVVIDIMPSSRRGEGLGYYGLTGNLAMAFGPMTGLFVFDHYDFSTVFMCALLSGLSGFCFAVFVKTPPKPRIQRQPLSLDRFILIKGLPAGLTLLLLSIPYGMTTTYVAAYAKQIGIVSSTGIFFTLMAAGTATARIFSGRLVDRGRLASVIIFGMAVVAVSFFIFSSSGRIMAVDPALAQYVFFGTALFLGLGFGSMFPAFNSLFVGLARNDQRGTATSTYLTSWDVGIGLGLVLGGVFADPFGWGFVYFAGGILSVVSLVYFSTIVAPHYQRNKLNK